MRIAVAAALALASIADVLAQAGPPPDAAPTVFTAIQEQLGLKLEPSKALRDVLVIDRLKCPTPN